MAVNLNTSTSIVDFLKSSGKPSDFSSRKALYDVQGFTGAFGDYRGTPEQNTTLLRKLSTPTQLITSSVSKGLDNAPAWYRTGRYNPDADTRPWSELTSGERSVRGGADFLIKWVGGPTPTTSSGPQVPEGFSYDPATNITTTPKPTPKDVIDETTPSTISSAFDLEKSDADKALEAEKKGLTFDLAALTTRGQETLGRDVETLKRTAGEQATELVTKGGLEQRRIAEQAAGFGGAFSGVTKKSQAEVAQEVAQKQGQIQAKLGDQLYNTFSDFEKNFGTKFLESLSVPEAEQFVKLPIPVRGVVMNQYQEAVQKAEQKAQKGALDTLEKLGYTVIGGQIVQTLQGRAAERADVAAERAERGLELREKSDIRQERASERADIKLEKLLEEKQEDSPEAIDLYARDFNAGKVGLSTIPAKVRSQVRVRAKEFAFDDLRGDIDEARTRKDFANREELISKIQTAYPEFSKDEVAREVYTRIPDQPKELKKGFFQRLFGR